jgi:glucokinase
MIEGDNNSAGEVGHMIVDLNGPFCTCGSQGCWEAFAGGWAITKKAQQLVEADMKAGACILSLAEGFIGSITTHTIAEAFKQNDPLAIHIANDIGRTVTAGCISLANILNPRKIILGGGIIEGFPFVVDRVQKGINKQALKSTKQKLEVCASRLNYDACTIGSATLALHYQQVPTL